MGSPNPDRYPPHPDADSTIAELVREYPGWVVFISCEVCWHNSTLRLANLAVLPKPPVTWGELKSRLRCHPPCGSRRFGTLFRYTGWRR